MGAVVARLRKIPHISVVLILVHQKAGGSFTFA